ncbi:MAG TPA: hypothetical protein VFQ63_02600 [Patescibacteria group bacterium]|nr:hypothetical protein [Patescibacteria group bacterium]
MEQEQVFHDLKTGQSGSLLTPKIMLLFIGVILLGIGTGFLVSQKAPIASKSSTTSSTAGSAGIQKGQIYGSNDTSTFKDTAEGTLQSGGIDGEGQYHLVRPGGDSQNVYMTSSIVDLSEFVNKQVKVWGETQAAQHAGWLMDVGRLEVTQ